VSKYTADEVEKYSKLAEYSIGSEAAEMLDELARRLRQEEEEAKRDPVTDPRPGDRIEGKNGGYYYVYTGNFHGGKERWENECRQEGATIIRRRESP